MTGIPLAVLRTMETLWRHERQTKNAVEIARQAGARYDKCVGFTGSLEQVGQLSSGKGSLVSRAKRLDELGAKTSEKLPDSLSDVDPIEGPVVSDARLDNGDE